MKTETPFTIATGEDAERILMGCGFYDKVLELSADLKNRPSPPDANVLSAFMMTATEDFDTIGVELTAPKTGDLQLRVYHFKAEDLRTAKIHYYLMSKLAEAFQLGCQEQGGRKVFSEKASWEQPKKRG